MPSVACIIICRLARERGNRRNENFSAVKSFRWFAVKYTADCHLFVESYRQFIFKFP